MLPERLETDRLILRPITRNDAPAIFVGYAQDPEVVRYVSWRPHQRLSDTETYIARCLAMPPDVARTMCLSAAPRAGSWAPLICVVPSRTGSIAVMSWPARSGAAG
ncbi:MAG: GNAT family N-acetyltransferase [Alphaproteobacteria bacterium]|nr:GNAT family N-acetyltransferase [Alphaproteobacteria bacterium]